MFAIQEKSEPPLTFMSNEQKTDYLKSLRTNVSRPSGSRPAPPSKYGRRLVDAVQDDRPLLQQTNSLPNMPIQLRRRSSKRESMLTPQPVQESEERAVKRTPSYTYLENGTRWMERQETKSLRQALSDMDLAEESRIHKAAQDEAAKLVWKHQNQGVAYRNPDVQKDYRSHLRKGSYHRSNVDAVPMIASRSSSASSTEGVRDVSPQLCQQEMESSRLEKSMSITGRKVSGKSYGDLADVVRKDIAESRRRTSSGARRMMSGDKKYFMHPDDKIWEDTEDSPKPFHNMPELKPSPSYIRKNPFARVRLQQPERSNSAPLLGQAAKHDRVEIQRNPPSQSRNAGYTQSQQSADHNEEREVRSDEIRAATSRLRKDRSPRLPQPTLVSDKPGRPIVSFTKPEIVLEGASSFERSADIHDRTRDTVRHSHEQRSSIGHGPAIATRPDSSTSSLERPNSSATTIIRPSWTTIPGINLPEDSPTMTAMIPSIVLPEQPNYAATIPSIVLPEEVNSAVSAKIPNIVLPEGLNSTASTSIPSVVLPEGLDCTASRIPSIVLPQESKPTASAIPQITVYPTPARPLPQTRPKSTPHYSPSLRQTGILCAHCALPIAGRVLSAAGERFHPGCFQCHECNTNLELVAFYPEPEIRRAERVKRIHDGIEEGDETLRFYCHLDFHETFSPRCKSCKTPIEGEIIVACGAEWHAGHFFCAQCGDPFDSKTPFVEKDGYAWCVGCHTNRYSSKCRKCRKPVIDVVVKALGSDWHNDCFRCLECNGEFSDGRYFLRGESQDPVCVKCEEIRLKA